MRSRICWLSWGLARGNALGFTVDMFVVMEMVLGDKGFTAVK